jgi:hypothetical protein
MIAMPEPIPLDMPQEHPDALEDVVQQVAGAARWLAEVDERLVGAPAAAPRWLGDDAAAASAQVGTVTALVRTVSDAMLPVMGRLATHADHVLSTRQQVGALRDEQREQFREAWHRWGLVPDLQMQIMIEGPDVRAIVAEVEAAEGSRRRRHSVLIEELAHDAAATARVLADACVAVGARGRPGDPNSVVAYLAAELPGWGDLELARLGHALAGRLTQGTPEERAGFAADAAPFVGQSAFANALLAGLGVAGFTHLLEFLDYNALGPDSPVARLLAAALGAAVPTGHDPVGQVMDAEYVRADDRYGPSDDVAAGLATVLAAGLSLPSGGVPTRIVAEWTRQLLLREHEQREPVGRRSSDVVGAAGDPTALAIEVLARRADPRVSAALLGEPYAWEVLLGRVWGDGGAALGDVVALAGMEPGAAGDHAVRTGLATVGSGETAGDPAEWTVNRGTLAVVAPALGNAIAAHIDVAAEALQVGLDGRRQQVDVLKGLGSVTLDRDAAAVIERALSGWAQVDPVALAGMDPGAPLPTVGVVSAYVAVQEYAQRADHAMDALEDREMAENKQWLWQHSVHYLPEFLPGAAGLIAGVLEGYAAIGLDMDGTWVDRVDRGLVFDRTDATVLALAAVAPVEEADARAVIEQAAAAFDRTAAVLGEREAPTSPETDWSAPVADLGIDFQGERTGHQRAWKGPRLRLPR